MKGEFWYDGVMENIYHTRIKALAAFLKAHGIKALVLVDNESHRDANIRYLTGFWGDGILVVVDTGAAILVAWDLILAQKLATASQIIPFSRYSNSTTKTLEAVLSEYCTAGSLIELAPYTTYDEFNLITTKLPKYKVAINGEGSFSQLLKWRTIKSETEIAHLKRATTVTNSIIEELEKLLKKGKIKTEIDLALFIERALREEGCERTGFDTLAAGPTRSNNIHATPGYTKCPWGTEGLSLVDFGVVADGYTSDVTLPVANKATTEQKKLVDAVQRAATECLAFYKPGTQIKSAMEKAESIFSELQRSMPHTLGHGIGLDIHESPRVSLNNNETFKCGMVVTLEPGLYDKALGGVRLENDVLITKEGCEVLTKSHVIWL